MAWILGLLVLSLAVLNKTALPAGSASIRNWAMKVIACGVGRAFPINLVLAPGLENAFLSLTG
jgi:hypothetical protein